MEFSLDRFYQLNRRILIWIALFGLVWLLRDYFALIFLTFILAFVAVTLTRLCQRYLRLKRALSVVIVYALFLTILTAFIQFVTPAVFRETQTVLGSLPDIQNRVLELKGEFARKYPSLDPLFSGYVRRILGEEELRRVSLGVPGTGVSAPKPSLSSPTSPLPAPSLPEGLPGAAPTTPTLAAAAEPAAVEPAVTKPAAATARAEVLTPADEEAKRFAAARAAAVLDDELVGQAFVNYVAGLAEKQVPHLILLLWSMLGTLLLALLFSFLITLDITRLTAEIQNLRASRLHDFYEQTAQPVVRFCYVLGRAFQAQAVIACVNTFLTAVGLLILDIPSVAMLSVIVFFCSFVPVLGVFISTTPIALVGVNAGGLSMAVGVVVLIVVVHAIEAYLLNPLIYGAHLKINPVIVLIILFVGHRAFGVWGMLLAVPVTHYLLHDVFGVPVWASEAKGGLLTRPSADKPGGGAAV